MFFNTKKKKTFIIAEIGNNHEGSISNAKKLINQASKSGVDAVKFQTFITDKFINPLNVKRFNQLKKFELQFDDFKKLYNFSKKKRFKIYFYTFRFRKCKIFKQIL